MTTSLATSSHRWAALALLLTHIHAGAQGTPILPPLPPPPAPAPAPAAQPKETPAQAKARQAREMEAAAEKRELERLKSEAAQLRAAAERERKAKAEAEARAARAEKELAEKARDAARDSEPQRVPAQTLPPGHAVAPPLAPTLSPSALEAYAGGPVLRVLPQSPGSGPGTLLGQREGGDGDEKPPYRVRIPYKLAMGETEVTFAQWDQCVAEKGCGHRPDDAWGRGEQPVMRVSWNDVQEYLAWINRKAGTDKLDRAYWYRLPTEAEWEYAARAGSDGEFSLGPNNNLPLSPVTANYDGNYQHKGSPKGEYRAKTVPVKGGGFQPNAWGLWHMHGNVWEWVQDCYRDDEYARRPSAPGGWPANQTSDEVQNCLRVSRGGSWNDFPQYLRSAIRYIVSPGYRGNSFGFRLARTLP